MAFHRNIRLLTWFNFFTDFRLYSAVAILYFAKVSGSFALGMSIFSITMISSALLEVPTGVFSDRIGRRKTIILGALAAVGYSIFYALPAYFVFPEIVVDCMVPPGSGLTCEGDRGPIYLFLVIGAILEGLSRSFYSGNNNALLHDTLAQTKQEEEFGDMLGKTSAMFQLALGISAVLGSILAEWSFPLIMWLSVLPQVICLFIALQMEEPTVHVEKVAGNVYDHLKEAMREFRHNRALRLLTISSSWRYAFGEASYQFSSAFINLVWPVWAIGIMRGVTNLFATLSFHFAGRVIKRFGAVPVMLFGSSYNRIVGIIAGLFPNSITLGLLSTTSLFYGTGNTAEGALMQKEFKPHTRASMASLSSFFGSLLFGVVSFSVGLVADTVDPQFAYLVMQGFLMVNIWFQWRLVGR